MRVDLSGSLNDRLSRLVAAWLAHPSGVVQALGITAVWFAAPLALGWSENTAVFWYLAYCTFISFATQFTLAYQNRRAEAALELALRNLTDMMKLDVAMAEQMDRALDELYVSTQAVLGLAKEIHEDTDKPGGDEVLPVVDPPLDVAP